MKKFYIILALVLITCSAYATNPTSIKRDTLAKSVILVRTNEFIYVKTSNVNVAESLDEIKSYVGKWHEDGIEVFYYRKNQYEKVKELLKNLM